MQWMAYMYDINRLMVIGASDCETPSINQTHTGDVLLADLNIIVIIH